MKKILLFNLTIALCLIPNFKIEAIDDEQLIEYDLIENANASNDIENFLNEFGIDISNIFEQYEINNISNEENFYGGSWIDDDNVPHVAFTKYMPQTYNLTHNRYENIVIELVEYTLRDLLELQSLISQLEIKGLSYIALNEPKNCIEIGLSDFEHIDEIKALIAHQNSQNINIIYELSDYYERYSASVYGGSSIHGDSVSATCSVGFKANKGSKLGFVTAAHCFDMNEDVYFSSNEQLIGEVISRKYSSTMDAEFVETNGNANLLQKGYGSSLTNNYSYSAVSSNGVVSGSKVISFGNDDSEVCKITSTNFEATYPDGKLSNLLQTDCYTGHGWSGGLTLKADIDLQGNITYKAIGIVNGGLSGNTVHVKATSILSSLGLTN